MHPDGMFSINLLSRSDKQDVRYGIYSRFSVFLGAGTLAALAAFAVLLIPSLLFLSFQKEGLLREVDIALQSQRIIDVEKVIREIQELNGRATALAGRRTSAHSAGALLDAVSVLVPVGVTLDELFFDTDAKSMMLRGHARKREDFLLFKSGIEKTSFAASVDSPISNIIKESNIAFTLTITLK